jgi:hypothetical protein
MRKRRAPMPTRLIEVLHGPMRSQRVDMPEAEAAKAIEEGWGRDPFSGEPAKEITDLDAVLMAAEAGARRLRGEEPVTQTKADEPKSAKEKVEAPTSAKKAESAEAPEGGYKTREETPDKPQAKK